jgi:alkylhydroperoxidase family enzyme
MEARKANSADAKERAGLEFVRKVVDTRGNVGGEDVQAVKDAGWDDGEISEMIANVAFNIFTNYFNHINETELDFPKVPALA